jgi:hypothetical protein
MLFDKKDRHVHFVAQEGERAPISLMIEGGCLPSAPQE